MLKVRVGYPTRDAEKEIVGRMAGGRPIEVQRVAKRTTSSLRAARFAELFMDQKGRRLHRRRGRATRGAADFGLAEPTADRVSASPRASIYLAQGARRRVPAGPGFACRDVKAMASTCRHRILLLRSRAEK